jgi:hypothetical protein
LRKSEKLLIFAITYTQDYGCKTDFEVSAPVDGQQQQGVVSGTQEGV